MMTKDYGYDMHVAAFLVLYVWKVIGELFEPTADFAYSGCKCHNGCYAGKSCSLPSVMSAPHARVADRESSVNYQDLVTDDIIPT